MNLLYGFVCVFSVCVFVSCPTWSLREAWSLPVGEQAEEEAVGRWAVSTFCPRYGSAARSSGCRAALPERRARPSAPRRAEPWEESFIYTHVLGYWCVLSLWVLLDWQFVLKSTNVTRLKSEMKYFSFFPPLFITNLNFHWLPQWHVVCCALVGLLGQVV